MNGHELEKWESTLNFVFIPMDTMLILSWMLLLNPLWYKFLYMGFGLLQSWFRPCSPFKIPFLGQVEVLVFCRSLHLSNLYFALPLSIKLWYLKNIMELHKFLWVLHQLLFLTDSNFPGFWVVFNREH